MDRKNLVDRAPPTLETLPKELQLQICQEMLRSKKPITLSPCEPDIWGFTFGSLGVLRVSKHFSEMALSVMYGENCFRLMSMNYIPSDKSPEDHEPEADIEINDDEYYTVSVETLRYGAWESLKNIPQTLFGKGVSSVDCLDMISQTSSGQKFLKHLQIDFGRVAWMRVMDGVLLRILKRMRGLQSLELNILQDWEDLIPSKDELLFDTLEATEIWHERNARDFLLLVKEELSHIKKITMGRSTYHWFDDTTIIDWMTDELKKRNEDWAPPLPLYKNFRRTISPISIMDADIAGWVVEIDDDFRSKDHEKQLSNLERRRGVF